jgi:hypothetical protein
MSFGVGPAEANAVVASIASTAAVVGKIRKRTIDVHRLSKECPALRPFFERTSSITECDDASCADEGMVAWCSGVRRRARKHPMRA